MNSDFTTKLEKLRSLLADNTSAQLQTQDPTPVSNDPCDLCPKKKTGACCKQFGCVDGAMEADCVKGGGTFQGPGTTCAANPCDGLSANPDRQISVMELVEKWNEEGSDSGDMGGDMTSDMPATPMG